MASPVTRPRPDTQSVEAPKHLITAFYPTDCLTLRVPHPPSCISPCSSLPPSNKQHRKSSTDRQAGTLLPSRHIRNVMGDKCRPKKKKGDSTQQQPLRLCLLLPRVPIPPIPPATSKARRQTELGMNQGIAPLPRLLAPKKKKRDSSPPPSLRKKGVQAKNKFQFEEKEWNELPGKKLQATENMITNCAPCRRLLCQNTGTQS
jgi:hypothetical protein